MRSPEKRVGIGSRFLVGLAGSKVRIWCRLRPSWLPLGVIFPGLAGAIDNALDGRGYTATEHLQRFRLKRSFIKPYLDEVRAGCKEIHLGHDRLPGNYVLPGDMG